MLVPDIHRTASLEAFSSPARFGFNRDSRYRAGRFDRWIKVKNRAHPAMDRVKDALVKRQGHPR